MPRKKVHSPTDANANGENVNMSVPSSTLCMGSASLDPATKINGYHEQNMKKYLNVSYIRKIKLRAMLRKVVGMVRISGLVYIRYLVGYQMPLLAGYPAYQIYKAG